MTENAKKSEIDVDQLLRLDAEQREERMQQRGERGLADPAEPERRQRDAELTGGQIGVELPVHLREQTAGQAVGARDRLDARRPQLDEPELRRDEKTIQRDEQQCADQRDNLSQSNSLRKWKASVYGRQLIESQFTSPRTGTRTDSVTSALSTMSLCSNAPPCASATRLHNARPHAMRPPSRGSSACRRANASSTCGDAGSPSARADAREAHVRAPHAALDVARRTHGRARRARFGGEREHEPERLQRDARHRLRVVLPRAANRSRSSRHAHARRRARASAALFSRSGRTATGASATCNALVSARVVSIDCSISFTCCSTPERMPASARCAAGSLASTLRSST